jgi:hypothetical protein
MQYTQQQYKVAIDAALAAGDRQSAEELAAQAAELYGPLQQPQQPQQPFGPGIGLQQASQTLQEEAQQFVPEVQRRFAIERLRWLLLAYHKLLEQVVRP